MSNKAAWLVLTVFATLVGAYALSASLVPAWRTEFVADLFARKSLRAFAHMAPGGLALAMGAFQFNGRLRRRNLPLHRLLGRVYVASVLISGTAAVLLAPSSSGGLVAHAGFGLLGVLWLITTIAAFLRVQAGDLDAHRDWMIRSYALCLAAVTLRLYIPASIATGVAFAAAYPAIAWLCWVPNLVVAEWLVIPAVRAAAAGGRI